VPQTKKERSESLGDLGSYSSMGSMTERWLPKRVRLRPRIDTGMPKVRPLRPLRFNALKRVVFVLLFNGKGWLGLLHSPLKKMKSFKYLFVRGVLKKKSWGEETESIRRRIQRKRQRRRPRGLTQTLKHNSSSRTRD